MRNGLPIVGFAVVAFLTPGVVLELGRVTLGVYPNTRLSEGTVWAAEPGPRRVVNRAHDASRRLYDRVMKEFRNRDYEAALAGFRLFMVLHADSPLASSAQYWIGECEYRLQRYQKAVEAFAKAASVSRQRQKKAAATVKMGLAYRKLGKDDAARVMLERVLVEFPDTPESTVAEKHLKLLPREDVSAPSANGRHELPYQLIDHSQASVNGIHFGSNEDEIMSALGAPLSVETGFDEPMAAPSRTLFYDGLEIYLVEGELYNLTCESEKCITPDGVTVGATREQLLSTYGRGQPQQPDAEGESLSYRVQGKDAYLVFHLRGGLVQQIELFLDYV